MPLSSSEVLTLSREREERGEVLKAKVRGALGGLSEEVAILAVRSEPESCYGCPEEASECGACLRDESLSWQHRRPVVVVVVGEVKE